MPGLRRIVLIATHLPGVVELKLDGHTNVCGTNASGKTTLQRLVPVFFGELPSKVVPRTRKKFSEFYLPFTNSYLIYEYEREDGQVCQAVITRKDSDSVQYRFVTAPFAPEQLLVEETPDKVVPLSPEQWLKQLNALGIEYSTKIHSTSEYRSIIQNDATLAAANSRENTRLRNLAARFSLVAPQHRIRHMEKLVSAVHAKEGKMDTLRTMLAAIFEEDGLVRPTTTVRSTKAREWMTQMRQTKRLQGLHQDFTDIRQHTQRLEQLEIQLYQLQQALIADTQRLTTERADAQQHLQQCQKTRQTIIDQHAASERTLNASLSENEAALDTVDKTLIAIQHQYDKYLDADMAQLANDIECLPLWRDNLEHQQAQYQLLIEQHRDLEHQLLQQKNTLATALDRLSKHNQERRKVIMAQRDQRKAQQQQKAQALQDTYEARREQLQHSFEQALSTLQQQLPALEYQAKHLTLTTEEEEALALAEKRIALTQQHWQDAADAKTHAENQFSQARQQRETADADLTQARRQTRHAQEQLALLDHQRHPEQGSLRDFLRQQMPGWEHTIGKLIHAPLLERKDLAPQLGAPSADVFGISLALSQIELPAHAQDEAALQRRWEDINALVEQLLKQQAEAETALQLAHQHSETQRTRLHDCQQAFAQAAQEVRFATESKQRLQETQQQAQQQRRGHAQQALVQCQQQLEAKRAEREEALATLKSDFAAQMLEFNSDWQDEIAVFEEQIEALDRQVEQQREQHHEQIRQLEDAFQQALADKDIDPRTLQTLKTTIERLQQDILRVSGRRDELSAYQRFLQVEWQQQRPQLLEQETTLKAQRQRLVAEKHDLEQHYNSQIAASKRAIATAEQHLQQHVHLLGEIAPLLQLLNTLRYPSEVDATATPALGDQQERISRCHATLSHYRSLTDQVKQLLTTFENTLNKDAGKDFLDTLQHSLAQLSDQADVRDKLPVYERLLSILAAQTKQIVEQGETIGQDLADFFKVFADINRKIAAQSKRLTDEVADELILDGIASSEVKILSTVDELNFWEPLKRFAQVWQQWRTSGAEMPPDDYLDSLAEVVEVLPNDASFSIESLLKLELRLNEGGSDLVIKNDRQLLESSSHGMAYLILCKFLLAFTRLLRNQANIRVHWPIDEIGTLAYHNVEKLFDACNNNHIDILGAFPNPESEVLMLFKNRYLIDKQQQQLQRIEPKRSRIAQHLHANQQEPRA